MSENAMITLEHSFMLEWGWGYSSTILEGDLLEKNTSLNGCILFAAAVFLLSISKLFNPMQYIELALEMITAPRYFMPFTGHYTEFVFFRRMTDLAAAICIYVKNSFIFF